MSMQMQVQVVRQDGSLVAQAFVGEGEHLMGQSPDCPVQLDSQFISPHHARLVVGPDGGIQIEDLNGDSASFVTYLDGQTVRGRAGMQMGQVLQVGDLTVYLQPMTATTAAAAQAAPAVEAEPIGGTMGGGRYELIKQLGRGGMGVVYLAKDTQLDEEVALKALPPEVAGDEQVLSDMKREVQKSRQVSHPNIIRIHGFENPKGESPFVTLEFVPGKELGDMRMAQPSQLFAWEEIKDYMLQLCDALEYAHKEKIVHRDLKPANIMINNEGRVKLADFGIAATIHDSLQRSSMKDVVSGTLLYMGPQQLDGQNPNAKDDIYALGSTLYELLTGRAPFYTGDIADQVKNKPPQPIPQRLAEFGLQNDVPQYVCDLVMACLAKNDEHRPENAAAIKDWILTEGGTAVSKFVRIPLWGGKALELDRRKVNIAAGVTALLATSLGAYAFLKPEPFYEKSEIQQEVSEGLVLHLNLDKTIGRSAGTINANGINIKPSEGAEYVAEARNSAIGASLSGTNHIIIERKPDTGRQTYGNYFAPLRDLQNKDYTLSIWYKPFSTPKDDKEKERQHGLIVKPGFHIGLTYSNQQKFAMSHQWKNEDGESILSAAISSGGYKPNKWYHVVGTVNREEGLIVLYINGKEVATEKFDANSPPNDKFGWNSWFVGAANPKGEYSWFADGAVDEVRIYNQALDAETVQKLHFYELPDPYGDGLKIFYPFDGDIKNSIANMDYHGFFKTMPDGRTPTNQPTITKDRLGKPNSAYRFDGAKTNYFNTRYNHGRRDAFMIPQQKTPRTLCAWFKPEKLGTNTQCIIGWGNYQSQGGFFGLQVATNRINGCLGNTENSNLWGDKLSEDEWYHVAMSYSDKDNITRLYLNGEEISTITNVLGTGGPNLEVGHVRLLHTHGSPSANPFTGVIDEVRVYDKALDGAVIKTIYEASKPPSSPWFLYSLGFLLVLFGAGFFLYRKGYRVPAKLLDPVLRILPRKLADPLMSLRAEATS